MANLVADVVSQALDAIGSEIVVGDLSEPTREAQVLMRAYRPCRQQLLRAAHWDFARKMAPLTLLADATGATPNVGNMVPQPWIYEYAYPIDCMKARFIPWNNFPQGSPAPPGNIAIGTQPLTTAPAQPPFANVKTRRARFVVGTDFNNPAPIVQGTEWWEVQGVSPSGRTVVMTNVFNAQMVYTADMLYPSTWDALFRAALVAYIASEVALPLSKDKKFGLTLRGQQIAIAKEKIAQARITDGNEGTYSADIEVDWMRYRRAGGRFGGEGWGADGPGVTWMGWDSCGFADGSAF